MATTRMAWLAVASRPRSRQSCTLRQSRANRDVGHYYYSHQRHHCGSTLQYQFRLAARERHSPLRQVSQRFRLPPHMRLQPTPPQRARTATQLRSTYAHFQRVRALARRPRFYRQPADARRPTPRLANTALQSCRWYRVCYQSHGPRRALLPPTCAALHVLLPRWPSAGASQAPRLMRCPVSCPLAALRWRCSCC